MCIWSENGSSKEREGLAWGELGKKADYPKIVLPIITENPDNQIWSRGSCSKTKKVNNKDSSTGTLK